ncbi:MAG: hypothetical protein ACK49N_00370 [Verrucomicrobiota bacterium]
MIKTQIQIPDQLYHHAKAIAEQREWSFAEVVRRGIEHMAMMYPLTTDQNDWQLPVLKESAFNPNFDQLDLKALSAKDELRPF